MPVCYDSCHSRFENVEKEALKQTAKYSTHLFFNNRFCNYKLPYITEIFGKENRVLINL